MNVPGEKIIQRTHDAVSAVQVYSATFHVELNTIFICNHTSSQSFSIYHTSGEDFSAGNALFLNREIFPNDTILIQSDHIGSGIQLVPGDKVGIGCSSDATFTFYGIARASR